MARLLTSPDKILAHQRWTLQHARAVLDALAASGLSVADFAERHGVQAQRLFAWRRRLDAAGRETIPPAPLRFVEIAARPDATPRAPCRYELVLASGDALRVEGAVDPDAVRALLTLLREARAC